MSEEEIDFGVFVEGVVELEPMSGNYIIRTVDPMGKPIGIDIHKAFESYKGEIVRFILTPASTIAKVAEMVEAEEKAKLDPSSEN